MKNGQVISPPEARKFIFGGEDRVVLSNYGNESFRCINGCLEIGFGDEWGRISEGHTILHDDCMFTITKGGEPEEEPRTSLGREVEIRANARLCSPTAATRLDVLTGILDAMYQDWKRAQK